MRDFIDQLDHSNLTESKELYRMTTDPKREKLIIQHVAQLIAEDDGAEVDADYLGAAKDFLDRE